MATLSLDLEDDVVAHLKKMAAEQDVTLDSYIQTVLVAAVDRPAIRRTFRDLAENVPLTAEPGRTWSREATHARPMLR